jgi:2-polyprenyl-3-methyl-5-hydroxy-6-metoxy-1,4-benzoquinol methylase
VIASRRPDAAGRAALALYRGQPFGVRAHVGIRWASCPFPPIEDSLPDTGRILEVGSGHGLFSAYAALRASGRTVHGVDIDADKIACAQLAAKSLGDRLTFEVGTADRIPDGPWDAIVVVDVIYLLEPDQARGLLRACIAQLAPDGVIVIKEMGAEPVWKARWNRFQETLAVRVLRITEGDSMSFLPGGQLAQWLREEGLDVREYPLDQGRLHPHHLVVGRQP